MVAVRISVDDRLVQQVLAQLAARSNDLTPAMDEIGGMLVASVQSRFERAAGPDGAAWPPLSAATLLRRGAGARPLRHTGRLYGSITHRADRRQVEVGSNVIYAAIHQLGGQAGRGRKVNIPARPYLGIDRDDETEAVAILTDHLRSAVPETPLGTPLGGALP